MEIYIKEIPYVEPFNLVANLPTDKNLVFFDSALRNNNMCRYSFIAFDPFSLIKCHQGSTSIDGVSSSKSARSVLSECLEQFSFKSNKLLPFCGGLAGYLGYEFAHYLDNDSILKNNNLSFSNGILSSQNSINPKQNSSFVKNNPLPDLIMGVFDLVIAFDHFEKRSWIYSSGFPEKNKFLQKIRARERCTYLMNLLNEFNFVFKRTQEVISKENIIANVGYDEYCETIQKVLRYIRAGDIYQANISQEFSCKLTPTLHPLGIYDRLRTRNPAPFAAFIRFGENVIASASPERFISSRKGHVITSPIKGTYPRSRDPIEDKMLADTLYRCEKNRAENLMIVDLMRNDLSKVCELFSVKVPRLFEVESYATLHHLVSKIQGKLKKDKNNIDLIAATFPGGSITGAPKLRAMQIINELEKVPRGPYCGSIGYFGFEGSMDTSILIRTFVIKDNYLTFKVGGGIVADSTPHNEYRETLIKANALYATLTGEYMELISYEAPSKIN